MRFGFEVRDANSQLTIDSDTFTVRMIDRFTVTSGGAYGGTIARPKAKPGMFCTFQYPAQIAGHPALPFGTVGDGVVHVSPLLSGTQISYPYECLVLSYV